MAPGLLTSEITINMLVSKEGASCCPLIHNVTLHNIGKENSSHVREPGQSWILDSMLWIPDSRYRIPVFVSRRWILDSNRQWDSGFLELYSGLQMLGFRIP